MSRVWIWNSYAAHYNIYVGDNIYIGVIYIGEFKQI